MKFNVQRVLTPAYLTSVALVVLGVVLGLAWYPVAAWLFVLLGLALNAMAVSVTAINDAPRTSGRRRPSLPVRTPRPGTAVDEGSGAGRPERREVVEPEAETAATPVVPSAGSSALKPRR
ncbi:MULTISPECIES: hypothetical protein [Kocuria]|jgi:hypothetical protein|uniref:hypothetical protein n=1 Tax=Kocuria TaxID=57493 RepID=UPI0020408AB7|nr:MULTISPECIES: hypothetical protein [Kocuria]MCM3688459.1 hypothetical protein [Kocuria rosea]HST73523.1 hypothetical protein [Kocuria rosea]